MFSSQHCEDGRLSPVLGNLVKKCTFCHLCGIVFMLFARQGADPRLYKKGFLNMNFTGIKIEDKHIFDRLLKMNNYVDAEYLFSTLFMWQDIVGYQWAFQDDCIYIRHISDGQVKYHFPICAPERAVEKLKELKSAVNNKGEKLELVCVTEEQLEIMGKEKDNFTIIEKRNYSDYLYDGDSLRTLDGKKLRKKRAHVSNFTKKYNWEFRIFTKEGEDLKNCKEILKKWSDSKAENTTQKEARLMDNESSAVERCMRHFSELGFIGGIMYIDGQPEGFTIGEKSDRGKISTGIIHYEKCNNEYDGVYQAINQMFAQQALSGVQYINRQEDMGVEGLRKAKLSYYPVRLVNKFTLKEI